MTQETAKGYTQFILVIILLIVIYLTNFALHIMKTNPQIQQKDNSIPAVTAISLQASMEKISFSDTAQMTTRSYIPITPEITGRITYVAPSFKEGLCFDKNQTLFKIDIHEVEAQFKTAQAELEQAKANLALVQSEAKSAIAEWTILNPTESIPPLVAKQPQIQQAEASIKTAQAKLNLAQIDLNRSAFSFPFAGCIESSQVEIGQFATKGQSLGRVFSKNSLEVIVNLPSDKAEKLKFIPHEAKIIVDDKTYISTIDRISDVIDAQTQFSKIILKPNQYDNLQPNKIVKIIFYTQEAKKLFVIQESDITPDGYIFLIQDNNKVIRKKIDIIGRTQKKIYISAFADSIKIARGNISLLKNNMTVKVLSE